MKKQASVLLVLMTITGSLSQNNIPEGIIVPLASIFATPGELGIPAIRYAISHFNSITTNPFALSAFVDSDVDVTDSFALASKLCERMENGIFMFFGAKNTATLDIVQSITKTFHMPYLSPSTSMWTEKSASGYEIHMKPDYSYAIVDMILHFEWTKVHYVYDSDEGLQHIQVVLSALRHVMESGHPYHVNVVARRIYNIEHAHDELRQLDRMEQDPNAQKVIVFDLSSEQAYKDILRQIPEVGMNKDGYHYLVATLDFANMDRRRYLHGGVNITGFQLLDLESKQLREFMKEWTDTDLGPIYGRVPDTLTYEAALAVDAIRVITRALTGMVKKNPKVFQSTFRRGRVYNYNKTSGVPCTTQPPMPWMHGDAIMEHIKLLDFEGLTGRLKFDDDGFRTDYKLDVYAVGLDSGPDKIGRWTPDDGFRSLFATEEEGLFHRSDDDPKIVTTILSPPFLMLKEPAENGKPFIENDRFKGYVVDLAQQIAEIIRFDYKFELVPDETYGSLVNGTWNGMVGQLFTHKADVSIAPLTITYDREKAVDFTKPFMNFGISIMIKKPDIMKPGVFSFMEPLQTKIWVCIVFAYCTVSVGLFLVSRFSPFEWSSSGPDGTHFNILNALWFAMGALMLQGSDACPRSFSGRVIGTVWWFFVLIIISSYTANLAAFLTIERMQTPIESADDLAKQTEIKYGTLESGSTNQFFREAKVPVYQKLWNYMESNPSVFVKTTLEGIERVKKSKGKYAFFLESPANEYTNNKKPCDTIKVGPHLNSKGFGIATPKNSPLSDQMNLAVLMLMEDGTLPKLKIKWWKDKGVCGGDGKDKSGKRKLRLSNVAGIFYILIGGLAMSVILASVEFLFTKNKFLDKTTYLKATETVTTLLSASAMERENGDANIDHEHVSNNAANANNYNTSDRQEYTYNYAAEPPAYIGFEQYSHDPGVS